MPIYHIVARVLLRCDFDRYVSAADPAAALAKVRGDTYEGDYPDEDAEITEVVLEEPSEVTAIPADHDDFEVDEE